MLYSVGGDYEQKRNHMQGNYRNPGHFMHAGKDVPATPEEVTERINRDVVMPRIELKAYKRTFVRTGETAAVTVEVPADAFHYYNRRMVCGIHDGDYTVSVGTSCTDIRHMFEVKVRDGKLL